MGRAADPNRPLQSTLFGAPEPARREGNIRDLGNPRPAGYAAPPGSGPAGETCGSCTHCCFRDFHGFKRARRFYKCELVMRNWTGARDSDVTLHSAACRQWEPGAPHETTARNIRHKGWND